MKKCYQKRKHKSIWDPLSLDKRHQWKYATKKGNIPCHQMQKKPNKNDIGETVSMKIFDWGIFLQSLSECFFDDE